MPRYEYIAVPAPTKGLKSKGLKTSEERFAHALSSLMNEYGEKGWEYQRTDTLPCEERKGLTGRTTIYQNMLIFRRLVEEIQPEARIYPAAAEPGTGTPPTPAVERVEEPAKVEAAPEPVESPDDKPKANNSLGGVSKSDPGRTKSAPGVVST